MAACSRALTCCRRVGVAAADWVVVRLVAARSVAGGLRRGARLRVIVLWCLASVVAAAGALLALAVPRQAGAAPSPAPASLPANCVVVAGTATCTFTFVGAVQSFVVPAGVSQIVVAAAGAQGADGAPSPEFLFSVPGGAGGNGGIQRGALAISGGQTLEVFVGGHGGSAESGGFNGGGSGVSPGPVSGGGGGGGSDVRTQPFGVGDRVIVGGGGGGGAGGLNDSVTTATGAAGGAGGADGAGAPGAARVQGFAGGGGGGAGGTGSGGAAGSAGQFSPNTDAVPPTAAPVAADRLARAVRWVPARLWAPIPGPTARTGAAVAAATTAAVAAAAAPPMTPSPPAAAAAVVAAGRASSFPRRQPDEHDRGAGREWHRPDLVCGLGTPDHEPLDRDLPRWPRQQLQGDRDRCTDPFPVQGGPAAGRRHVHRQR